MHYINKKTHNLKIILRRPRNINTKSSHLHTIITYSLHNLNIMSFSYYSLANIIKRERNTEIYLMRPRKSALIKGNRKCST